MSYICKTPPANEIGTLVDDGNGRYKGECVSVVKRYSKSTMPATKGWSRGELAKGNTTIQSGTAIATFGSDGKFATGHGHAGIYIEQTEEYILVWDQYDEPKKPLGQRRLYFDDKKTDVNNGNKFYIIESSGSED
jgi:hypothetical protein